MERRKIDGKDFVTPKVITESTSNLALTKVDRSNFDLLTPDMAMFLHQELRKNYSVFLLEDF